MTGLDWLPKVKDAAVPDIRDFLETLYRLCNFPDKATIVELGVRNGDSTRALLCGCMDFGKRLYSYDIRECRSSMQKGCETIGFPVPDWWSFEECASVIAGLKWVNGPVGLLFIDTIHTYPYTLKELVAWDRHCTGIICGHDYCNTDTTQNGVAPSVQEYMEQHGGAAKYDLEVDTSGLGLFVLKPKAQL